MLGIEILSESQVPISFMFNWKIFWIVTISLFVFLAITINASMLGDSTFGGHICITLILAVGASFIGTIGGNVAQLPSEHETQYKVTISEEVLMTEFLDKYEIIETEGKIFIIREIKN